MNKSSRFLLLVAIGIVASIGIGLKLSPEPTQVVAQDQSSCGGACTTDSNCGSSDFCHTTINWGNWQIQPTHNLDRKNITGFDSYITADGTAAQYFVSNGQVYRCLSNSAGVFGNCEAHLDTTGDNTVVISGQTYQNPIVSYNASLTTENGVQTVVYHLVRYRGMYSKKINYNTGAIIQNWARNTDLDSYVASYGDNWNNWLMLSFDSEKAYEDGRTEQRLIIGLVNDKNTLATNDDVIDESIMLSRVNKMNSDGSLTWSGVPFTFAGRTTWNSTTLGLGTTPNDGAQGSVIGFDKSFNSATNKYSQTVIRTYSVGSGQYENAIFIREADKRANQEKLCKPKVYPESCTLPSYFQPLPTLTPPPPHSPTPSTGTITWTKPANLATSIQCANKKVNVSWPMPLAEGTRTFTITTRSCLKTAANQTDCPEYHLRGYDPSYNQTTQKVSIVRDFAHFAPQGAYEPRRTYLMAVRVGYNNNSSTSEYSNYIPVTLGYEGDMDNTCFVNRDDYSFVQTEKLQVDDPFGNAKTIMQDNLGLFWLQGVISDFGKTN